MVLIVGTGLSSTRRTVDCSKHRRICTCFSVSEGVSNMEKKPVFSRPVDELKDRLR